MRGNFPNKLFPPLIPRHQHQIVAEQRRDRHAAQIRRLVDDGMIKLTRVKLIEQASAIRFHNPQGDVGVVRLILRQHVRQHTVRY
jgi:hypothetical protein